MEDENGISIRLPDTKDAIVLVTEAKLIGAVMTGFEGPQVITVDDVERWSEGVIYAYYSDAEQSSDVTAEMVFYSTVEFPQE